MTHVLIMLCFYLIEIDSITITVWYFVSFSKMDLIRKTLDMAIAALIGILLNR